MLEIDRSYLWIYEDQLPPDYPYDQMFEYSDVFDGVRMFPQYPVEYLSRCLKERDDYLVFHDLWNDFTSKL
jgi:hypothetical protein